MSLLPRSDSPSFRVDVVYTRVVRTSEIEDYIFSLTILDFQSMVPFESSSSPPDHFCNVMVFVGDSTLGGSFFWDPGPTRETWVQDPSVVSATRLL